MGRWVKTTVEIDDALLIAAKKRAAEERRPLRALFEEALRAQLAVSRQRPGRAPKVQWVVVDGGLPAGLDPADRAAMSEWILSERGDRS